jgi:hypothetical protein
LLREERVWRILKREERDKESITKEIENDYQHTERTDTILMRSLGKSALKLQQNGIERNK